MKRFVSLADKNTIEQYSKKHNIDLNNGYVRIDEGNSAHFISDALFAQYKMELEKFDSVLGIIKFSIFNDKVPYSSVPGHCNFMKNKFLDSLNLFLNDTTQNKIAFKIILKGIADQPLFLVEAFEKFPDNLPENELIYFRHYHIFRKVDPVKDKFNGFKKNLEDEIRLLAVQDEAKFKKLLQGLFFFTEQFISDLKRNSHEYKYLDSLLFEIFFKEIIYFKSYYQSAFGDFHFPEINEIEKKIILKKDEKAVIKKKRQKKILNNLDSNERDEKIIKALYRLDLFKEQDTLERTFLKEADYEFLKKQVKRFILTNEYDKPKQKFDLLIDPNVIRYLFLKINSDLYMKSEKLLDRKTRDFIGFMMDFFKFNSNWIRKYISGHFKDSLDTDLIFKYGQYLKN